MKENTINFTAWVVIACLIEVYNSKRFGLLVSDESAQFYKRCMKYCARKSRFLLLREIMPSALFKFIVNGLLSPGAYRHYACRKHAILEQATACYDRGVRQFVVIGGGFDLFAYGQAKRWPGARFFEIDTPAMNRHKVGILSEAYNYLPENYIPLAAMLGEAGLKETLQGRKEFKKQAPTVFIAEGVSMYLPSEAFKTLLVDINELASPGSIFLFTAIAKKRAGHKNFEWLLKQILSAAKSSFSLSLNRDQINELLAEHAFGVNTIIDYRDLQKQILTPQEYKELGTDIGEYLVNASPSPA
jgi:methyltransferase (TIGR00027 family)